MSMKERRRLAVLSRVKDGQWTLKQAAQRMGVSHRQAKRLWARYRDRGDAGLVHGLRGRAGNRRIDASLRDQAVRLYREHYSDFGCTLACEYLSERHGLKVDDQTLRRWLKAEGLWARRRRGTVKRRRRQRRACFGELVQIDGSHHDWFEGRRGPCVLMVMIDDATGWTLARFFESETTIAVMTVLRAWAVRHGLPGALYPDRHSIYRVNTKQADQVEARTGKRPTTQFGRAMGELGVSVICAHSPQAKGRVERMNGTLQDRLVKALRVAGISDVESANRYLDEVFVPELNERFAVEPADATDAHAPVNVAELDLALCERQRRVVSKDQCVSWEGVVLQLEPTRRMPSLSSKPVTVRRGLDGTITVTWQDHPVPHQQVTHRPASARPTPSLAQRVAGQPSPWRPPPDHPWRRGVPRPKDSKEVELSGLAPFPVSPSRGKAPQKYASGHDRGHFY